MIFTRIYKPVLVLFIALAAVSTCVADTCGAFLAPGQRPSAQAEQPWPVNKYLVLAYHDVEDGAANQQFMAVRTSALNDQFAWLKNNGYHIISIDDVIAAQQGKKDLPRRAVMLTFDDGYSSFYRRVFPLLKAYNWHALLAPVGTWLDTPSNMLVNFGGLMTPRNHFLNWAEVHEMAESGLVEIGAHTYAEHQGIVANPQGNSEPYAVSLEYDKDTKRYESMEMFEKRLDKDIRLITRRIISATGKAPRVWVWPYGMASGVGIRIAKQHGYKFFMSLDDGVADIGNNDAIPRTLISGNPSLRNFAQAVAGAQQRTTLHVVQVDMDYVYDADSKQQDHNIDLLVQRIADLGVNRVFLQAFADPDGDGNVKALYFPNRWLPMRADLFNHVAWQLQTRAGARVYAWMPVLAFQFPDAQRVLKYNPETRQAELDKHQYHRLSPFNSVAQKKIIGIYEDLAIHNNFEGILFHDDAFLSDYEDASPDAIKSYQLAGFPADLGKIRQNPKLMYRWTRFKSLALINFTNMLMQHVRAIRGPQIKSARNIYALPIVRPASEAWFAQNLDDFLAAYDWTVPMAMPLMEHVPVKESAQWLAQLVTQIAKRPGALDHTVIELQAVDWSKAPASAVSDALLVDWVKRLQCLAVGSYGYYPDDFIHGRPVLKTIRPMIASKWYPLP